MRRQLDEAHWNVLAPDLLALNERESRDKRRHWDSFALGQHDVNSEVASQCELPASDLDWPPERANWSRYGGQSSEL